MKGLRILHVFRLQRGERWPTEIVRDMRGMRGMRGKSEPTASLSEIICPLSRSGGLHAAGE